MYKHIKNSFISVLLTILFLSFATMTFLPSEVPAKSSIRFNYVGVDMCKLCHKGKDLGDQFDLWTNTSHSKAFYTLGTSRGKAVAKKAGINDPQRSGKCLKCHSTAYAFTEKLVAEDLQVEDGVQCESCHGAGEEYTYMDVMENLKDAKSAGLVMPTEKLCRKCHNPESPTWNPRRDITPAGKGSGFYFPLRWKMIEHHKPKKK